MNLIVPTTVATRNETLELASTERWLISNTTGGPAIGQVEESVVGSFELTRSKTRMDQYHAMKMLATCAYKPLFDERDADSNGMISGRRFVERLLEGTPITMQKRSNFYDESIAPFMNYDPSEVTVKFEKGKFISGVLDKSTVKGEKGSIFHNIALQYGNEAALLAMYNIQGAAIKMLDAVGCTIGLQDLILPVRARVDIKKQIANIFERSNLVTQSLNRGELVTPIGGTIGEFYERQQMEILKDIDRFRDIFLGNINVHTNNLINIVISGSKGSLNNLNSILAAVGLKTINEERLRETFGLHRTMVYTRRFDTHPIARGYVSNSFVEGITSVENFTTAASARFDFITKSLTTSVTGAQSRKSVKNLESIVINNFRWCTKNSAIVQLAYGETHVDPRYVQSVVFETVMMSDSELTKRFGFAGMGSSELAAIAKSDFEKLREDREKYRTTYLKLECMEKINPFSDTRLLCVNVEKILKDSMIGVDRVELGSVELLKIAKVVRSECDALPYLLSNESMRKRGVPIPVHVERSVELISMLIRIVFSIRKIVELGASMDVVTRALAKVKTRFRSSLIEPGTAAGIIAAQCFSEPLVQYMLDAHHRASSGGTSQNGMIKATEILSARDTKSLSMPTMYLPIKREYETDKAKVREIADNIEVMELKRFVKAWQIFYEDFGKPVHELYSVETSIYENFAKSNPLLKHPNDLTKWCLRFVIDRTSLILKNMSLETIVMTLRAIYSKIYVVYTPENSKDIILRIHLQSGFTRSINTVKEIKSICSDFLSTVIRGVEGIASASVEDIKRHRVQPDGSVERIEVYYIATSGTNMLELMKNKYIDRERMWSDAIKEIAACLGIEAARRTIIMELRNLVKIYHAHYLIYADEMTFTGVVTSIEKGGVDIRESSNILLRTGSGAPVRTLELAAINNVQNVISGVTAPLMMGSVPKVGTLYNKIIIDEDFVVKNRSTTNDWVNDE